MKMSYSLLAHLYPYIKGSQEDIATYSLQYLLSQSEELNRAFTKRLMQSLHIQTEDTLQYLCQVTGKSDNKERPDMAGIDSKGIETILCEMKFYASLTINQPLGYIDRLKNNNGKGLIFVCPNIRLTNLWATLNEICKNREVKVIDDYCITVDGINLSIITWSEIIELLKQVASSVAINFSADISQLEGYCTQIDSEAFVPFSAEDLSAEIASKRDRYYQVIDEIIDLFCADKKYKTSKKRLKATAYRKGYTRSLYIDEYTFTINYDRDMWKHPSTLETPFWISLRAKDWKQPKEYIEKFRIIPDNKKQEFWNMTFLALEPLQNSTLSEVCEDMKRQIEKYFSIIK